MRCIFNAGIDRKLANLGATIVPSLTYSGYRNTGVVSQLGNSIYNLWLRNNKKDELGNYIFVLYGDAFDKPLPIRTKLNTERYLFQPTEVIGHTVVQFMKERHDARIRKCLAR